MSDATQEGGGIYPVVQAAMAPLDPDEYHVVKNLLVYGTGKVATAVKVCLSWQSGYPYGGHAAEVYQSHFEWAPPLGELRGPGTAGELLRQIADLMAAQTLDTVDLEEDEPAEAAAPPPTLYLVLKLGQEEVHLALDAFLPLVPIIAAALRVPYTLQVRGSKQSKQAN